jgi:hypothetical protein
MQERINTSIRTEVLGKLEELARQHQVVLHE